mmetsp:Transcript_50816/g.109917  ORF Transcript_50816/g.109917 Transcript_50816/m.109917 type:complete len:403 (-) Transcript_50816:44-1252(-)
MPSVRKIVAEAAKQQQLQQQQQQQRPQPLQLPLSSLSWAPNGSKVGGQRSPASSRPSTPLSLRGPNHSSATALNSSGHHSSNGSISSNQLRGQSQAASFTTGNGSSCSCSPRRVGTPVATRPVSMSSLRGLGYTSGSASAAAPAGPATRIQRKSTPVMGPSSGGNGWGLQQEQQQQQRVSSRPHSQQSGQQQQPQPQPQPPRSQPPPFSIDEARLRRASDPYISIGRANAGSMAPPQPPPLFLQHNPGTDAAHAAGGLSSASTRQVSQQPGTCSGQWWQPRVRSCSPHEVNLQQQQRQQRLHQHQQLQQQLPASTRRAVSPPLHLVSNTSSQGKPSLQQGYSVKTSPRSAWANSLLGMQQVGQHPPQQQQQQQQEPWLSKHRFFSPSQCPGLLVVTVIVIVI